MTGTASFLLLCVLLCLVSHCGAAPKRTISQRTNATTATNPDPIDKAYSGTAVQRMTNIRKAIVALTQSQLSADWLKITRLALLQAGGMRNLQSANVGQGYDGHCFNDFNHVDLAPIRASEYYASNNGRVSGIEFSNPLGPGIVAASIPTPGPGGSWCTCSIGCNAQPVPQDVCHIQFKARVAFKLVWAPPNYTTFVLVDDSGKQLNYGTPNGTLPALGDRQANFQLMVGSKFATAALAIGQSAQGK